MEARHLTSTEAIEPVNSFGQDINEGAEQEGKGVALNKRFEVANDGEQFPLSSYPTYVAIESQSEPRPPPSKSEQSSSAGPSRSKLLPAPEEHGRAQGSMSAEDAIRQMSHSFASFMGTSVKEMDAKLQATLESQKVLEGHIDRLMGGLDKLLEDIPLPLLTQQIARLSALQRRVQLLAANVQTVQGRINNMNRGLTNRASRSTTPTKPSATIKLPRLWPNFVSDATSTRTSSPRVSSEASTQALPLLPPPPRLPLHDHGEHHGATDTSLKNPKEGKTALEDGDPLGGSKADDK